MLLSLVCILGSWLSGSNVSSIEPDEGRAWRSGSGSGYGKCGRSAGEEIWDAAVAGLRRTPPERRAVAYVLIYRTGEGRQRWHTIGRHGAPWTPETAREEARRVAWRGCRRGDPAADKQTKRKAATVAELCRPLSRRCRGWPAADAPQGGRRRPARWQSIAAGSSGTSSRCSATLSVAAVTREDVDAFMHDVADGKTAGQDQDRKEARAGARARRQRHREPPVGLLGAIFTYAVRHRMRAGQSRRMASCALPTASANGGSATTNTRCSATRCARAEAAKHLAGRHRAARFLALTGWRSGEALGLRWSEIDLARRTARLADTKTGRGSPAVLCRVRRAARLTAPAGELVFPATRGEGRCAASRKCGRRLPNLASCRRRHAARAPAFVCVACRRSRLLRTDHRRAGWPQGALDHIAIRPRRRRGAVRTRLRPRHLAGACGGAMGLFDESYRKLADVLDLLQDFSPAVEISHRKAYDELCALDRLEPIKAKGWHRELISVPFGFVPVYDRREVPGQAQSISCALQ